MRDLEAGTAVGRARVSPHSSQVDMSGGRTWPQPGRRGLIGTGWLLQIGRRSAMNSLTV